MIVEAVGGILVPTLSAEFLCLRLYLHVFGRICSQSWEYQSQSVDNNRETSDTDRYMYNHILFMYTTNEIDHG